LEQLLIQHITLNFDKKKSRFVLSIRDQQVEQNVCEFLLTSSFLVGQNVEEFLLSTDSCYDNVKIPLTSAGKSVTVELCDFIALREVYNHQMYQLKLEELLSHRGVCLSR
jgi:hypothetical protein